MPKQLKRITLIGTNHIPIIDRKTRLRNPTQWLRGAYEWRGWEVMVDWDTARLNFASKGQELSIPLAVCALEYEHVEDEPPAANLKNAKVVKK